MSKWIIFTDLDGTLLDHDDYNFVAAHPALTQIQQLNLPLIINSSKTYAEIKDIREQMHNYWAFAVENGAAVFLPQGESYGADGNMKQSILGRPIAEILAILSQLREQYSFVFKGFSDYSVTSLMAETGLHAEQAKQAKQRLASEPIKWLDSEAQLELFKQQLIKHDLQLLEGGRFFHVMGKNDKSQAMSWLLSQCWSGQKVKTIALGDSQNDKKMLEQADVAAVIRKSDGSYLRLSDKRSEQALYSQYPGPLGWQEVMDQLFVKLKIGA